MSSAVAKSSHQEARTGEKRDRHADGWSRFHDPKTGLHAVRIRPGEFYTTDDRDEIVVTILGSCVAACIRDPRTGYGGMNHFMLPESAAGDWNGVSAAMRYGNFAMEALINAILSRGGLRADLEIKLFGGADLGSGSQTVGTSNAEFAVRYLESEGLHITAQDLGGNRGRRVHYRPSTGKVDRQLLKATDGTAIGTAERNYNNSLRKAPVEGDIELFD